MTVNVLSRCMCVRGKEGGVFSSIFRRRSVWLKRLHSIHIKAKSEKHIHHMATIFYSYGCISINDLPLPNQAFPLNTLATKCLAILKGIKEWWY